MNTRLQENIGLWEANAFVQGTAFVLSLAVMWIFGKGHLRSLTEAPWWNLLGGALGLVITVTVMLSIKGLNPTIAISTILIAQLLVAAAIDYFGWMGQEKNEFRLAAVDRGGADAHGCFIYEVEMNHNGIL